MHYYNAYHETLLNYALKNRIWDSLSDYINRKAL